MTLELEPEQQPAKTYKATLHIATAPFSYMEVEVEDTMSGIIIKSNWLLEQHANKPK